MFDTQRTEEVMHLDLDDSAFLLNNDHDPRITELEAMLADADRSAKKIEQEMKTYNAALQNIQTGLDRLTNEIDSSEYFYRDNEGNMMPGVKAIEFDLARTKDPKKTQELKEKLAAAKERMARFIGLYEEFSESTGPSREEFQKHLSQLDSHLAALKHQRQTIKKQLDEYIASKHIKEEEDFYLTHDEQLSLVSALKTYLRESQTQLVAEVPPDSTLQLKKSIKRFRENPDKELIIVQEALNAFGVDGLSLGEAHLLYERLSHADVNILN